MERDIRATYTQVVSQWKIQMHNYKDYGEEVKYSDILSAEAR